MKIAIVIPAYNEEKNIRDVLKDVGKANLPVFVVDDGSSDGTHKIARKSGAIVLRHEVNLGKGAAMKTGAEAAFNEGYEAVVFMDSDGQHKKEDLPKFLDALDKGCGIVFGTRNLSMGVPLVRYFGNKIASLYVRALFGIYVSDLICGYRAVTKKAYKKIEWESQGYGVETEMVVRAKKKGVKHCEVPVETVYLDKFKGVTILDAFGIFFQVLKWRIKL